MYHKDITVTEEDGKLKLEPSIVWKTDGLKAKPHPQMHSPRDELLRVYFPDHDVTSDVKSMVEHSVMIGYSLGTCERLPIDELTDGYIDLINEQVCNTGHSDLVSEELATLRAKKKNVPRNKLVWSINDIFNQ
jgi:hypothetical protein